MGFPAHALPRGMNFPAHAPHVARPFQAVLLFPPPTVPPLHALDQRTPSMGLVSSHVVFESQVPPLARIAEAVTAIAGLPVAVHDSAPDELYDLRGCIAFAALPDVRL